LIKFQHLINYINKLYKQINNLKPILVLILIKIKIVTDMSFVHAPFSASYFQLNKSS